ncbi:16S rRNA (adenine(1518)-N(6)/adenine(1519)-N(6))-dimethyltransferase RsmA [Candidatus Bipolaricaulota bacterium]|nr:16S rRNA (adenine(1518)-N(6)/adenine(1519)-N(6))-dimethyltransferase RsmA [Candidatus Bipolaricaulota bacterium]
MEPDRCRRLTRPSELRALLSRHGIRRRRGLGQHFLVDGNVLGHIVEAALEPGLSRAVEVGAGVGTLTCALAPHLERLWAVELDPRLIPILKEQVAPWPQVEVIHADFLTLPLAEFGRGLLVVGNLPYRITSQVLLKLIREREGVAWGVFLTQREVAEKLAAPPGPQASRLGTHLRAYYDLAVLRRVPRTVFYPPPEVDSALIRLRRLPVPRISSPPAAFEATLKVLFAGRRKTLRRALRALLPREEVATLLADLGIDPQRRGETLDIPELDRLARALHERGAV